MTGADLRNLVNEAALWATRQNKDRVSMDDFEFARDKVLMGVERKSVVMSDHERATCAYHEAGHAVVAALLPEADRAHCMVAVCVVEQALREHLAPDKINLAALGTMVPHLHWHVIPRFVDDKHFPNPLWGAAQREGVAHGLPQLAARLRDKLAG